METVGNPFKSVEWKIGAAFCYSFQAFNSLILLAYVRYHCLGYGGPNKTIINHLLSTTYAMVKVLLNFEIKCPFDFWMNSFAGCGLLHFRSGHGFADGLLRPISRPLVWHSNHHQKHSDSDLGLCHFVHFHLSLFAALHLETNATNEWLGSDQNHCVYFLAHFISDQHFQNFIDAG